MGRDWLQKIVGRLRERQGPAVEAHVEPDPPGRKYTRRLHELLLECGIDIHWRSEMIHALRWSLEVMAEEERAAAAKEEREALLTLLSAAHPRQGPLTFQGALDAVLDELGDAVRSRASPSPETATEEK